MNRTDSFRSVLRRTALAGAMVAALVPTDAAPAEPSAPVEVIQLSVPSGSSAPSKPRATFVAETEGSPQPTIVGGWSEDSTTSNEAHLTFAGGHAVGERTTFVGTWVSPMSTSSKSPSMTIDYQLACSNMIGNKIPIVHAARARFAGGKWGPWAAAKTPIAPSQSSASSGSVNVNVELSKPRRVQFQWKIKGEITGPAVLQGDFLLTAS